VPKEREKCHIQVDDQTLCWEEGKTMVFDDTFEHEVWNETGQDRIVLLVQFKRPVRFPGNLVANLFLAGIRKSSFVQTVRRNLLAMGSKSSKLP
jgi:beta-hydroxylase